MLFIHAIVEMLNGEICKPEYSPFVYFIINDKLYAQNNYHRIEIEMIEFYSYDEWKNIKV